MSFMFTWAHDAREVFVTGTFDGWSKSIQLEKHGEVFQKTVPLPHVVDKILYKFVVDGQWIYDHSAKTETDNEGIVNNVLFPSDITQHHNSNLVSGILPGATTTNMAAQQPLSSAPGAFPETPAVDDAAKDFSVNPIPASSGARNPVNLAAGEPVPNSSSLTSQTLTSNVHDDPELKELDQKVSVAPIPATGGASNPVHLAPGEKVPHPSTYTANTLQSNVKLDQASYEKSDTGAPVLPPPLSPGSEREAAGAPIFGFGTGTMIPESSLPMSGSTAVADENVGPTMSSVAPKSTTAQLAAAVPLEPRGQAEVVGGEVPEIVQESQQAAHVSPEASANTEAVAEKSALEQELKQKVPEEPATSTSGTFGKSEGGIIGAAAGGLAAVGAAAGYAISSVAPSSTTTGMAGQVPKEERSLPRGEVPEIVQESQHAAHVSPEASANPEAVQEKTQLEKELQTAVPKAPATSESGMFGTSERGMTGAIAGGAATVTAAAAGTAYALREKTTQATGTDPVSVLPTSMQQSIDGPKPKPAVTSATITDVSEDMGVPRQFALGESPRTPGASTGNRQVATAVPSEVVTSQKEAKVDPEASAVPEVVQEKSAVEQELLSKVKAEQSQGAPAPSTSAALSPRAPAGNTTAPASSGAPQLGPIAAAAPIDLDSSKENKPPVSGDVSPLSRPTEPTVTTGVATARIPRETPPQKRNSFMERLSGTPDSSKGDAAGSDGKNKRRSFFGKLKDKFKS